MQRNTGFTLIELLIVTAIIAVLSTISLSTFAIIQRNSRDSKRMADLKIIQSGLEQYKADQGFYPACFDCGLNNELPELPVIGGSLRNSTGNFNDVADNKLYQSNIPHDPLNDPQHRYYYVSLPNRDYRNTDTYNCDNTLGKLCSDYCLTANLENQSNPSNIPAACDSIITQSFPGGANYAVKAP